MSPVIDCVPQGLIHLSVNEDKGHALSVCSMSTQLLAHQK